MRRFTWSIIVVPAVALLAGCALAPPDTANVGPNTPGWTGRTVVVGRNSTSTAALQATYWAKKWGVGRRN